MGIMKENALSGLWPRSVCLLSIVLVAVLISCEPPTTAPSVPIPKVEGDSTATVSHLENVGAFSYSFDAGSSPKDVYFVFTNIGATEATGVTARGTDTGLITVDGVSFPVPEFGLPEGTASKSLAPSGSRVNRRSESEAFTVGGGSRDIAGTSSQQMLYMLETGSMASVSATCRKVVPGIATGDGQPRTLNIWVADDVWDGLKPNPAVKEHYVTQVMVDAMANRFLKAGLDNDIYDWVSNALGAEWGPHEYGNLIDPNGEITIFLCDIDNDNQDGDTGGLTTGFFHSLNNYKKSSDSDSNERVMFVIDAVAYANPDSANGWTENDYWAREMYSTLAHEFQHMIHYYQKDILNNVSVDYDWLNEMCSLVVEDLVARDAGFPGPRSVPANDPTAGFSGNTDGRIAKFNRSDVLGRRVDRWIQDVESYSVAYAFGAWLARNHGGAPLIGALVKSDVVDTAGLVAAVKQVSGADLSFGDLLQHWGASILLSDKTDAPVGYRFNTGGWFNSMVGQKTYSLGSVNAFNYQLDKVDGPQVPKDTPFSVDIQASSNAYLLAAGGLTGSKTWTLNVPSNVRVTVVVKGR